MPHCITAGSVPTPGSLIDVAISISVVVVVVVITIIPIIGIVVVWWRLRRSKATVSHGDRTPLELDLEEL